MADHTNGAANGAANDGATQSDSDVTKLVDQLDAASERVALNAALDALAASARDNEAALQLLLQVIVERNLAEVSIRKIFFDEGMVDDAVQETVLAVVAGIGGFRGDSGFLTWLDRVALNAARQIRRRGQRLSEPVSNEVPEESAWARRLSSVVADEVMIADAFARLSEEHSTIVRLREIEGLSYEEIADRLGLAVGTVRSRLSRARSELASQLVDIQRGH